MPSCARWCSARWVMPRARTFRVKTASHEQEAINALDMAGLGLPVPCLLPTCLARRTPGIALQLTGAPRSLAVDCYSMGLQCHEVRNVKLSCYLCQIAIVSAACAGNQYCCQCCLKFNQSVWRFWCWHWHFAWLTDLAALPEESTIMRTALMAIT